MESELMEMMQKRRSVRTYVEGTIPDEMVEAILQAGMLSPSGKAIRPWEFIVVRDKEMLQKMALCRENPVKMLQQADCAIVVLGDEDKSDVWADDCAVVMANMHLMADSLGLGSCWVQGRLRKTPEGTSSEDYLRSLLGFPEHDRLEAVLALGMIAEHPEAHRLEDLPMEKVHRETF